MLRVSNDITFCTILGLNDGADDDIDDAFMGW